MLSDPIAVKVEFLVPFAWSCRECGAGGYSRYSYPVKCPRCGKEGNTHKGTLLRKVDTVGTSTGCYNILAPDHQVEQQVHFHLAACPPEIKRRSFVVDKNYSFDEGSPLECAKSLLSIYKGYLYAGSDTIPQLELIIKYLEGRQEQNDRDIVYNKLAELFRELYDLQGDYPEVMQEFIPPPKQ